MPELDFATTCLYPGVIGIHAAARGLRDGEVEAPDTVHPYYLDMHEDFEPPLAPLFPPDTGTPEGTEYQFVANTAAVHHARAWHLVGWRDWELECDVRFPNDILRASNAGGPHSDWYSVAVTGTAALPVKRIEDSSRIVVPPESPVPRAGTAGGILSTNCGMTAVLGAWAMGGLTSDFYTVSDEAVDTVNNWTADGATLIAARAVRLKVEIRCFGNTGLLRYRAGVARDGAWRYPSICWAEIRLSLHVPDYEEGIFEAADGSHDADVNVGGGTTIGPVAYVASRVSALPSADAADECGEMSIESLSPDPPLYISGVRSGTEEYRVPWLWDDTDVDYIAAEPEVANAILRFTVAGTSVLPAAL